MYDLYIFVSDFFKKTINTYLKLEICVMCREFLAFKYAFVVLFESNQMIIYICTPENSRLKQVFLYTISIFICFGR